MLLNKSWLEMADGERDEVLEDLKHPRVDDHRRLRNAMANGGLSERFIEEHRNRIATKVQHICAHKNAEGPFESSAIGGHLPPTVAMAHIKNVSSTVACMAHTTRR